MGLFDMFGAGGGSLSIQPVSPHVTPGQALVGNVIFQGGGRSQQINALTIRLTQETRTMQMTNQGPQPRSDSREICPATPLTHPFQSTPGQPTTLPFQLQLPPGLPNSMPQQVTYHLRVTADIPGEVDPGASLEIQVVGGMQPQMGMPGQMMPGQMMPGMPGQMPGMPGQMMGQMPGMPGMPGQVMGAMGAVAGMAGQMMPGQMMPGQMMPGQMMPGQMMPGMQQPGMGQMQIAPGTRVHAQWHGDGQLHPGTVRGFENGMYQIDWQEPHLGGNGYVYAQQIQVPAAGAGMHGHAPAPMGGMPGKGMHEQKDMKAGMQPDPYGKGGMQPDPYGKGGMQPDPYGKGGAPDMHGKGGHDPYGKGGGHDMHGKGGMQPDPYGKGGGQDMHGKGGHDPYAGKGGGHDMQGQGGGASGIGGPLAIGKHVLAQHPNGQWYPGRVVSHQNGMIGVDWDDAKLGQSSWVQLHQARPV